MDIQEQNNTLIVPVPDRKRLRREYLMQKVRAYTGALMCTGMVVPTLLVTLGFAVAAIFVLVSALRDSPLGWGIGCMISGILAICSVIAGLVTWSLCQESVRFLRVEARLVPYAPPVNLDTLPAEEILVRSSEEPPIAPDDLLRSAMSQATPEEELLRITHEAINDASPSI